MSKMYSFSRHDITEILLKVASNTINQTKPNGIPSADVRQMMVKT
jgi:hypothetical protein